MKFLFIFFICISFWACNFSKKTKSFDVVLNNKPNDKNFNIVLRKKCSLKGNMIQRQMHSFVTSSNKYFFVIDSFNNMIYKYDKIGKFIDSFGGKGKGPGEFVYVSGMIFNNDTLYVIDNPQRKTHLFSEEGKYYHSKQNDFPFYVSYPNIFNEGFLCKAVAVNSNSIYTSLSVIFDKNFKLMRIDTLASKRYNPKVNTFSEFNYPIASSKNSYFFAKNSKNIYQIDEYDTNFKKIREIKKMHRKISLNKYDKEALCAAGVSGVPKNANAHNAINNIYCDKFNRLWVLSGNEKNTNDSLLYFDVFKKGKYVNTVSFNILTDLKSKLDLEDYFYMDKNYIFVYNKDNQSFDVYEYG